LERRQRCQGLVAVGDGDGVPAAYPGWCGVAEGADEGGEGGEAVPAVVEVLDDGDADGDEPSPPEEPGEGVAAEHGGAAFDDAGDDLPGQGPEGQERIGAGQSCAQDECATGQGVGGVLDGDAPSGQVVEEGGVEDQGAPPERGHRVRT